MKLLIYIPTYNRQAQLEAQLKRIVEAQSEAANIEIKVVISANSQLALDVSSYNLQLQIIQQPSNIGGNINIALGFLCFKANLDYDYFWILSDDDLIENLPSTALLNSCKKNEIDMIHLGKDDYPVQELSPDNFLNYGGYPGLGLISLVLYSRKMLEELDLSSSLEEGIRFSFPHLTVIYESSLIRDLKVSGINFQSVFNQLIFEEKLGTYNFSLRHFPYFLHNFRYWTANLEVARWAIANSNLFWRSEGNKRKLFASIASLIFVYPLTIPAFFLGAALTPNIKSKLRRFKNYVL